MVGSCHMTSASRAFRSRGHVITYINMYCLDFDKLLIENLIKKQLSIMKLKNVYKKAIYLALKVYGSIIGKKNKKEKQYVKVKELKNLVIYNELFLLINKNFKILVKNEK